MVPNAHQVRPATWEEDRELWELSRDATLDQLRRSGQVVAPGPIRYETYALRGLRHHLFKHGHTYVMQSGKRLIAYARCIVRDTSWELTEFFTLPGAQGQGAGSAVLATALEHAPPGSQRLVVASIDPPAMASYLKVGMAARAPVLQLESSQPGPPADLGDLEPVAAGAADVSSLDVLDMAVLGFRRTLEHQYWLESGRRCYLLQRGGSLAGYIYVGPRAGCGPGAAVRAEDGARIAAFALAGAATTAGHPSQTDLTSRRVFAVPGDNLQAITALLQRGAKLLPVPNLIMAAQPLPATDRYLSFGPYVL